MTACHDVVGLDASRAADDACGGRAEVPWLSGARRIAAVAGVWARVAWVAGRVCGSPWGAVRALRLLGRAEGPGVRSERASRLRMWTRQKCVGSAGRAFWDPYVPGWPSRAFDRCVESEIRRVQNPRAAAGIKTAIVAVTRRCALRCEHCVESAVLRRPEALSADDLSEIVRRVREAGAAQFFLTGGEPLRRFDDLIRLSGELAGDADVWIVTSGDGLTPERAQRLLAAGVTGVAVSLDHWDATEHDRFRGRRGAFAQAIRAARCIRDADLVLSLWLCATRAFVTAENLRRYAETARSLGAGFVQIVEARAAGAYAGRDVALGTAEQRTIEDFAERLAGDPSAGDLPVVRYLDGETRASGDCGAGDRYAYVDTEGAMHACPFCRGPGVRVLDHGVDEALSRIRDTRCAVTERASPADGRSSS